MTSNNLHQDIICKIEVSVQKRFAQAIGCFGLTQVFGLCFRSYNVSLITSFRSQDTFTFSR